MKPEERPSPENEEEEGVLEAWRVMTAINVLKR